MKQQKAIFSNLTWVAIMLGLAGFMGCSHEMASSADLGWPTDLPQAQAEAKTQKKMVLIDFNGSDWCPACIQLSKKVFSTPTFKAYAEANLKVVDADFPHNVSQPAPLKAANEELLKKFNVEGFPTIIVLDGDGKVLEKMEGPDPDPAQFIAHLDKLKAQVK